MAPVAALCGEGWYDVLGKIEERAQIVCWWKRGDEVLAAGLACGFNMFLILLSLLL